MIFLVVVMDGFAIAFSDPPTVRQFKHGQSNPTYYVEYGGQRLVIRKKPVSNYPFISIEINLNSISTILLVHVYSKHANAAT